MSSQPRAMQRFIDAYISPALSRVFWKFQLTQDEFPGVIGLEVTSFCNLRCPMCPRTFSERHWNHMPLELVQKLIDEIAPYDQRGMIEQIGLQGYGEIFLHPHWFEIVEYASPRITKALLRLDTNGTMMKPPVVEKLFRSQLRNLIISVDGVDETSYNYLRAGGNFKQVIENIQHFIERRKREPDRGPTVQIQIIESDYSRPYLPAFKAFWAEQLDGVARMSINVIPFHNFAGQIKDDHFQPVKDTGLHVNLPCHRLTYEMEISADGVTSVCCLDSERQLEIGNVNQVSIKTMWHGPKVTAYREQMKAAQYGAMPLCQTCPHSQKFVAHYADAARLKGAMGTFSKLKRRHKTNRLFD
jgi:MoaA/NifB/PqqE/SkfB family radical SAM enzyme